jgi:p90 ribosomal S6 kinase
LSFSSRIPFPNIPGETANDILNKIIRSYIDVDSGVWCEISIEAKDLIRRMLHVDPTQRPTAANILKHPWIMNRHRLPLNLLPDIIKDPVTVKVLKKYKLNFY